MSIEVGGFWDLFLRDRREQLAQIQFIQSKWNRELNDFRQTFENGNVAHAKLKPVIEEVVEALSDVADSPVVKELKTRYRKQISPN